MNPSPVVRLTGETNEAFWLSASLRLGVFGTILLVGGGRLGVGSMQATPSFGQGLNVCVLFAFKMVNNAPTRLQVIRLDAYHNGHQEQ